MVGRAGIQYWGPSAWNLMHTVSFNYAESPTLDQRESMFAYLHSTAKMLPCLVCRQDWMAYLNRELDSANSKHLGSRDALSRFLVDGHNAVNDKLGKTRMSYDQVRNLYLFDADNATTYDISFRVAAFVIVLVVIFVVCSQGVRRKTPFTHFPCRKTIADQIMFSIGKSEHR